MIPFDQRFKNIGPQGYSLIIITISSFRHYFKNQFKYFSKELSIFDYEFEDCYDWIISNALNEVLNLRCQAAVSHHTRHDVYRCVYLSYTLGMDAKISLNQEIDKHGLRFIQGEEVKLLVTGENIIIARNFPEGRKN